MLCDRQKSLRSPARWRQSAMKLNRTFAILVCVAASMACATASIAGDGWRVVQTVGTVHVGGESLTPVALTNNQALPGGAWVETAASGRALLVRGTETIAVAPMSRVQLPSAKVNGNTQVLQSLGSVLYRIGKEKTPHFQVDTPYLAAVVKGTTFTVTVKKGAASVEVTEGLVEVAAPGLADSEFVHPGFTGTVREHEKTVTVDVTVTLPEQAKPDEPKSTTRTIVIPQSIGEVTVDVKEVSQGLINQPSLPPTANQTAALNPAASNGGGESNSSNGSDNGNAVSAAAIDLTPPNLGPGDNGNSDSSSDNGNAVSAVAIGDLTPPDLGGLGNGGLGGNGGAGAPDLTPPDLGGILGNGGGNGKGRGP